MFETFAKLILIAVFCVIAAMLGVWVIALVATVFALFAVAYLLNLPFTVTQGGKRVGTFRRSTGLVPDKE